MLRTSAAAFTPGETVHQTPIKTTGAATAAADEDEELCAWLQQKASLTKRVVDKVLPKLHDEDVYDVSPRPSSLPRCNNINNNNNNNNSYAAPRL